ncbi:MAG: transposase [bacterium]
MARPLRINVAGGWYHITARGQRRERIYYDARDRMEFLGRVEEMTKRYGVDVHAYVLMPNHYHLLIRTPKGNASAALQWLNNGYGMWWNRRHRQSGHVFQGRFKSILVEGGGWILGLSLYLHFNPVAVGKLGWSKRGKRAEGSGLCVPSAGLVRARLETLRRYRWSSYRAYTGYEKVPAWLRTEDVLARVHGGRDGYREQAEARLRQGQEEAVWAKVKWGAVLGSEKFAETMRRRAVVVRETQGRSALRNEVAWKDIVSAVEEVRGERWPSFRDRHGDWGRDLALWVGRRRGGMTLNGLGEAAGGMDYSAVSEAIRHFEKKALHRAAVRVAQKRVMQILNLET